MAKIKNIVVWGGSGFIGSHVCDALTKKGYNVTIADSKPSKWINSKQKMFVGNVEILKDVKQSLKSADAVFNFAGISDIEYSNKMFIDTMNANIIGAANTLEACKIHNIKKYIFASSIYVYSDRGGFYRASKQASEEIVKEFGRQNSFFKYNIIRFGTVYGTRSDRRNAIYRYLEDVLQNKKIKVNGSKDMLREYIHVKDVANYTINILENKNNNNECYLVSGFQKTRSSDLFKTISEITQKKISINFADSGKNLHYQNTPYAFRSEEMPKKIIGPDYVDFGYGLMELIDWIKKDKKI
jgi:UDP-glucose 4-epimerase|tara:strand:- start:3637 stop:4530 length:894 start_codon:yes stop_codon:yes gene_type:complete